MRPLLLASLLVGVTLSARAQSPAPAASKPTVILFVGNSFTFGAGSMTVPQYHKQEIMNESAEHFGGVPAIFKKFADETVLNYEVHAETNSGKDLEYHYTNFLPAIAQAKWNDVVLQGYSTEPVPKARGGKPESFLQHAELLEKAIHAANPAAKVYLYETWPYAYKPYPDNPANHLDALTAMADDLHAGYQHVFTEDGHFEAVAPVGDAWLRAIRNGIATDDPMHVAPAGKVSLWGPDHKHPSVTGSYLSALVLFEQITGTDPRKLGADEQAARDLGIARDDAIKLQAVAAETLTAK